MEAGLMAGTKGYEQKVLGSTLTKFTASKSYS